MPSTKGNPRSESSWSVLAAWSAARRRRRTLRARRDQGVPLRRRDHRPDRPGLHRGPLRADWHRRCLACTPGVPPFAPVTELALDQFRAGVTDKLLDQIALVRLGPDHVADGGNSTLISGVVGDEPIHTGTLAG